jgi:predicted metal-dependent peptidase
MPVTSPAARSADRAPGAHRGSRALGRLVEYAPHSSGLALRIRHVDEADVGQSTAARVEIGPDARPPVSTDGSAIFYARAFEALDPAAQAGWLAHAVLHVALCHPQRFVALREAGAQPDLVLYGLCADAIVNSALAHLGWLRLPAGGVRLPQLLADCLGERADEQAALAAWDVERLYRAIDDRRIEADRVRRDGKRAARARALAAGQGTDLRPEGAAAETPETRSARAHEWTERLRRAQAGDGLHALVRSPLGDLPSPRTPWEQVLRTRLGRALAAQPDRSWSRPSRRWLALRGGSPGLRMPWEPGLAAVRRVPRLALVLDCSGSVDEALYARFLAEIAAIARRAQAGVVVIAGDDAVREVVRLEPGRITLAGWRLPAGGGTDFAPLLREVDRQAPDIAVVLTDLQGPAAFRPRCPVIWAVPSAWAHAQPPFGRRLVLD